MEKVGVSFGGITHSRETLNVEYERTIPSISTLCKLFRKFGFVLEECCLLHKRQNSKSDRMLETGISASQTDS